MVLHGKALVIERKVLGSECHTLIELDVVADDAGGANDYARANYKLLLQTLTF